MLLITRSQGPFDNKAEICSIQTNKKTLATFTKEVLRVKKGAYGNFNIFFKGKLVGILHYKEKKIYHDWDSLLDISYYNFDFEKNQNRKCKPLYCIRKDNLIDFNIEIQ